MMPLARYALYAQDIDIYVAPTWDTGEAWLATLRHIAREAGLAEAPAYACANQFTGTATKKRCSTFKVRVLHEGRFEAGRPQANAGGRRRGERENWGGLRFHSINELLIGRHLTLGSHAPARGARRTRASVIVWRQQARETATGTLINQKAVENSRVINCGLFAHIGNRFRFLQGMYLSIVALGHKLSSQHASK
jgi:hypothetical protein